jgi:hypothetical protein
MAADKGAESLPAVSTLSLLSDGFPPHRAVALQSLVKMSSPGFWHPARIVSRFRLLGHFQPRKVRPEFGRKTSKTGLINPPQTVSPNSSRQQFARGEKFSFVFLYSHNSSDDEAIPSAAFYRINLVPRLYHLTRPTRCVI